MAEENTESASTILSSNFDNRGDFSSVPLEMQEKKPKNKRVPKRILYFSDGTLEEYSSSDEEDGPDKNLTEVVDPKSLTWGPWFYYYVSTVAHKSFAAADFCGEKLAWFFGITSPKYGYALEEYKQTQKEIEEEKQRERKLYEEAQGLSSIDVQVVGKSSSENPNRGNDQEEKY